MYCSESDDIFEASNGQVLCRALIKTFDAVLLKPTDLYHSVKLAVFQGLKGLLAVSKTAKVTALDGKLTN